MQAELTEVFVTKQTSIIEQSSVTDTELLSVTFEPALISVATQMTLTGNTLDSESKELVYSLLLDKKRLFAEVKELRD